MKLLVMALAAATGLLSRPITALAESPSARSRPAHYGAGAGGFLAATGPADYGSVFEAELYPGGRWGRYGLRAELRAMETGVDVGWSTLGLSYEAAATRPRLQLALHGDLGISFPDHHPVLGGGVQTQLFVWGPLGIGFDGTATLIVDGLDSTLVVASIMTVRIGV